MANSLYPASSGSTPTPYLPGGIPSGLTLRHTITSSQTFSSWVGTPSAVYIVLAGGGGGGSYSGGGGGGVFAGWVTPSSSVSITIGAGGTGSTSGPTSGGN